jgi:hypothetical protein
MTIGLDRWLRLAASAAFPVLFRSPVQRLALLPLSERDLDDLNLPDDLRARHSARSAADAARRRVIR